MLLDMLERVRDRDKEGERDREREAVNNKFSGEWKQKRETQNYKQPKWKKKSISEDENKWIVLLRPEIFLLFLKYMQKCSNSQCFRHTTFYEKNLFLSTESLMYSQILLVNRYLLFSSVLSNILW